MMSSISKKYAKRLFSNRGFTLMEIVIAMVVTSIIMMAAQPFVTTQIDSYILGIRAKYALQHVRIGMERVLSELRNATVINGVSSNTIDFDNADGENIVLSFDTFTYDGQSVDCLLYEEVGGSFFSPNPAMPLVTFVDLNTSEFTFLDINGNVTSTAGNVQIVQIRIDLDYEGFTYTVTNQVAPLSL